MRQLWKEKTDYKKADLNSWDGIINASLYCEQYLPYERLYDNLTPEELDELISDAKRLGWIGLDLRMCGLEHLDNDFSNMRDLKILALGNYIPGNASVCRGNENKFTSISGTIGNNSGLQLINIISSGIAELPDSIGQLTNLIFMDCTGSKISELPHTIGQLVNLRLFDLRGTRLSTLPDSIGGLSSLSNLFLNGTRIHILPETIGNLNNLRLLDLRGTPITMLPDSFSKLSNLQVLLLGNTKIRNLPDGIFHFPHLETLDLSGCHVSSIPYSAVETGLPFVISNKKASKCINLTDTALDEGELSLFLQPRDVIEEYYHNRATETVNECKVIFLGDGAAGKSSLIERIIHDNFQEGSLPTDGVKMTKWKQWPDGKPLYHDSKPLILRFLDFGGQEIMHSMHRCFLTNHTIYVVVCESRDDAEIDSVAVRWMETVRSFAPGCPVILALSKADLNPHVTVNERTLRTLNPDYRHMIRTSAKRDDDLGVRQLIDSILQEVPNCISKMSGNKGFLDLKNDLEALDADYILPEQFQERCEHFQIKEAVRGGLLDWFQDLGIAYTYTVTFRQVYVLNPAWLTNGIYRLILRTENGGFLRHSIIRETLGTSYKDDVDPDKTYTPQEMEFILHIMRKFEISLRVTPDYVEDGVEMIPMKMDKTPPRRYDEFSKIDALHLRWEAGYLPNNLVHRLMIRKYPELDPEHELYNKCVWRTGGWFRSSDGCCDALVEMADRALDVYVQGKNDARVYMDSFRQQVIRILEDLNIEAKEYVFCSVNGKDGKVLYRTVMKHYRLGEPKMYVEDLEEFVSPDAVLNRNYIGVATRDYFISYNNGSDKRKARWIAETLRQNGYTVFFQEDDCIPGMDFLRWMEDSIPHSRGFLAVWSKAYEESDYCRKELHAATVRQHNMKDYTLLPVRVENTPIENALFQSTVRVDLLSGNDEKNRTVLLDAVGKMRRTSIADS